MSVAKLPLCFDTRLRISNLISDQRLINSVDDFHEIFQESLENINDLFYYYQSLLRCGKIEQSPDFTDRGPIDFFVDGDEDYMMDDYLMKPEYSKYLYYSLASLTLDSFDIGKLMTFAIDHSKAATFISRAIARSIVDTNHVLFPEKIARLYLISDILFNSSMNASWEYQECFKYLLPIVFKYFGKLIFSISQESNLRAHYFKYRLIQLIDLWFDSMVFSESTLMQFVNYLELPLKVKSKICIDYASTAIRRFKLDRKWIELDARTMKNLVNSKVDGRAIDWRT